MIQKIIKRITDFSFSLLGFILLIPLFLIISLLTKTDSKGPVFFRQNRLGKNGNAFLIWKFRTMVEEADKIEFDHSASNNDPRITRVGKFLREWTLDEWPQLINVIKGEMSLVGPRPLPIYQGQELSEIQKKRLRVLPGMISLVDIKGRNLVPWEERFKIDSWYINNWSLWLDLKILFLAPFVIFSRKGVYGEGGTNLPPKK